MCEKTSVQDAEIQGLCKTILSGQQAEIDQMKACLLYTSDAADERSSVDLGGRRIIKKKKKRETKEN